MSQTEKEQTDQKIPTFKEKVWITTGIVALVVVSLWILKATFSVLLLLLAGSLIAILFRGLGNLIHYFTKWNKSLCLIISVVGSILIMTGLFLLIGAKVQAQADELMKTLPKTIENARENLKGSSVGKKLIDQVTSQSTQDKAQKFAKVFFKTTFGVLGDIYVVLFIGMFFTASPKTYAKGIIYLVPVKGQQKTKKIFEKLDKQLFNWLMGKLFSMIIVFILTAIGLAILGVKLWLVLALLAGLLSFVPNFGPVLALIPAILVALMKGTQTAVIVTGLYILIQVVESNFITPLVQKKLISMPPALIIIAQVVMGVLTGGWGLVLATPLTIILIVLLQELYLKERQSRQPSQIEEQ